MIVEINDTDKVRELYKNWTETCVQSALQKTMGKVYAPEGERPDCAVIVLGDFAFYAGKPNDELVTYKPENKRNSNFIIMIGDSSEWDELIKECYGDKCKLHVRYQIRKDTVFDRDKLTMLKNALMSEYELKMIDQELYDYCIKNEWAHDFVGNFTDYEEYHKHGLGVAVMYGQEMVAGVSSYSYYNEGLEIEVVTREDHRRKGLATAAAARFILECLDRNLYPSWDAANLNSVALSKKLGYELDHEYNSYEVNW